MSWHPQSRFPALPGGRAHCVDAGQGPPLLLVHGYLHSSWTWRGVVQALAPRHRVLAPDLPGHGWGEPELALPTLEGLADWLAGVLDARGVERLPLAVGHSLGGAALLALALREPARFERLLLVSPLAAPLPVPGALIRPLGGAWLRPLFQATAGSRAFVRRVLAWTAYKGLPVDAEVLRGFTHLRRPGSHRVAVELARRFAAETRALARRLPELALPRTLVWGGRDGVLPLIYGRRVAHALTGGELELFEHCGHCPHEEDPERFLGLLRGLLAPGQAA